MEAGARRMVRLWIFIRLRSLAQSTCVWNECITFRQVLTCSCVNCFRALLTPDLRGYGPISHDFQRLLEQWARNAAPKLPSAAMAGAKLPAEMSKLKLLASGATVKTNTQAKFKRLEAMYKVRCELKCMDMKGSMSDIFFRARNIIATNCSKRRYCLTRIFNDREDEATY